MSKSVHSEAQSFPTGVGSSGASDDDADAAEEEEEEEGSASAAKAVAARRGISGRKRIVECETLSGLV